MTSRDVEIRNHSGLHTRPGTLFVQLAKSFQADISVRKGERRENAKSLPKLMRIGVSCGDKISIESEGPDETAAVERLSNFLAALEE